MKARTAHLALPVLLASAVPQARPGPPASQAAPDPRDPQAQPERRVDRERKDLKAQPVETVSRDPWVCQDLPDRWDPQERMETRERLESLVRREARETKENTVPPVLLAHKARLEPPVPLVLTESPVPEASRVCLVRREMTGPEDSPDPPAQLDCRAYLALPVRKERLEMLDRWVRPVPQAPEAPPDPRELTDPRGHQVASETPALWERRAIRVRQESQDFRENLDRRVREESEERRESPVLPVLPGLPVPKVPPETTGPKEAPVPVVSLAILAPLESLVRLV